MANADPILAVKQSDWDNLMARVQAFEDSSAEKELKEARAEAPSTSLADDCFAVFGGSATMRLRRYVSLE